MKCPLLISVSSDLKTLCLSFSLDIKVLLAFFSQSLQRPRDFEMSRQWTLLSGREDANHHLGVSFSK